jgi:hypothetical protein
MKLCDVQSQHAAFKRRCHSRSNRLRGLADLFQAGQIDVRRFRHLTALLKSEHRADCRESGMPVGSEFK